MKMIHRTNAHNAQSRHGPHSMPWSRFRFHPLSWARFMSRFWSVSWSKSKMGNAFRSRMNGNSITPSVKAEERLPVSYENLN